MTKIEIEKSEYEELVSIKSEAKGLQEKVTKLEDETKNKSIAIDEAKEKLRDYKKTSETTLEQEKKKNTEILEKLGVAEGEDPLVKIEQLSTNSTEYSKILEKEKEERVTRIEDYKTKLGEEFLKEKASLFDGLDDLKQEAILKDFVDLKGLSGNGTDNTPRVNVHNNNAGNGNSSVASDFDKLLSSGASADDLINSLD